MSTTGILTIDLDAIASNWQYIQSHVGAKVDCAAVVKADAYSVGVHEVAPCLFSKGCRSFFAATLVEASDLRMLLPREASIYVLGGLGDAPLELFIEHNLIPVLYSVNDCQEWLNFCIGRSASSPCAVKFDTGMSRFGMYLSDFSNWLDSVDCSFFNPVLAMSHLACADEPASALNGLQLEKFIQVKESLLKRFAFLKFSLANSSGTFLGAEFHFDVVRIGASLYGINPQVKNVNPLRQVLALKLPVLQLKQAATSISVGYKAEGRLQEGGWLAVVAGGYADGLHRTLGFTPEGWCQSQKVLAAGRVSMDSIIFDVTDVNEKENLLFIEVINSNITLDYLMEKTNSLGYEVLTSLGSRFVRHYVRHSECIKKECRP